MAESMWRDKAACLDADPEVFFPDPSDYSTAVDAKQICDTCTVTFECLAFAVRTQQRHGIWGGTSPTGRASMGERGCRDCNADVPKGTRFCDGCSTSRRDRGKQESNSKRKWRVT